MNDKQSHLQRRGGAADSATVDGTIAFGELCLRFWQHKWRIVGLFLIGAAIGFLAASGVNKTWRATALIQIGKVRMPVQADSDQILARQTLVELPESASRRAMDPVFVRSVLETLSLPAGEEAQDPQARLIRTSLSVGVAKGTDLLELRVSAYDRDTARRAATAVVDRLSRDHERIAAPTIKRLLGQLETTVANLARAAAERERLLALLGRRDQIDPRDRFSESVLLGDLLAKKESEIRTLVEARLQLEEQLAPSQTFPTALLSDVHVPVRADSPKRSLFTAGGGALGLVAGILWALLAATRVRVGAAAAAEAT